MSDFNFDKNDAGAEDSRSASRSNASPPMRRAVSPGRASLSFGGVVVVAGGLVALLALYYPQGYRTLRHYNVAKLGPIWSAGAAAIGLLSVRVRVVRFPRPYTYFWSTVRLIAALAMAFLIIDVAFKIVDNDKIAVGMTGGKSSVWVYVLMLAGGVVGVGAIARFVEQAVKWGKDEETGLGSDAWRRRPAPGEEDVPPKPKSGSARKPPEVSDLPDE